MKAVDSIIAVALAAALGATGLLATPRAVGASPGPAGSAPITPIQAPKDRPYPGLISLRVDAADVGRRIIHVHERVTGLGRDAVLLYPKWLPGTHAPEGPIDRLAGIKLTSGGKPLAWTRDPAEVYAFRVHLAAGVDALEIDFDYLSPTTPKIGAMEMGHDVLMIEWNNVVLYPAGYFVRRIPVDVGVTLPADWRYGSALEAASATAGADVTFKRTDLETLIDSPLYAGRYTQSVELDPGSAVPVRLDLFADRPGLLAITPEQIAGYRALVSQAYKLYGSHHYAHYDFLFSLSDEIQHTGLEHHQSSEDGSDPETFTQWTKTAYDRDLLAHEFTHSWNGKFRRPFDLWTPNYNVPMQDTLLWVYEGQTEYWGQVLAARAGLRTRQQALDDLALTAAAYQVKKGRLWRPLQDTTNDEIINPRRPQSWPDWQRFEDYYREGALIWLEADTLIRERSNGARSLDDFARAFFGIDDGDAGTVTYAFDDVVKALNAVQPYDWAAFLRERLDSTGRPAPLAGLSRGGYSLVYTDKPSEYLANGDDQRKRVNLWWSIGIGIDDKDQEGTVSEVAWASPAFDAHLIEGDRILAVNGVAYGADVLKESIRAAATAKAPIELIVKSGDRYEVVKLDYHEGLRYPHLERDASAPARLDDILAARP